jgi:hypothetical protein
VADFRNPSRYWLHDLLLGVGVASSDPKQR